jgi:hypothetical protein
MFTAVVAISHSGSVTLGSNGRGPSEAAGFSGKFGIMPVIGKKRFWFEVIRFRSFRELNALRPYWRWVFTICCHIKNYSQKEEK